MNYYISNVLLYWLKVILVIIFSLLYHITSCEYTTISCHFCYILQLQELFQESFQVFAVMQTDSVYFGTLYKAFCLI